MDLRDRAVLVGGSGFVGGALRRELLRRGGSPVVVDRRPPPSGTFLRCDLLLDDVELPAGPVVLLIGPPRARPARSWELAVPVVATARLLPALTGRRVTLLSAVDAVDTYGGPATGDRPTGLAVSDDELDHWGERALALAARPCPPYAVAGLARDLVDGTGRWAYAVTRRAQELLVRRVVAADRLSRVRAVEAFGPGHQGPVARLTRRALAGLALQVPEGAGTLLDVEDLASVLADGVLPGVLVAGTAALPWTELAGLVQDELRALGVPRGVVEVVPDVGEPVPVDCDTFTALLGAGEPPAARLERQLRDHVRRLALSPLLPLTHRVPVVVPPRPERPDVVAQRTAGALESGALKHGGRWTRRLETRLHEELGVGPQTAVLATSSGSAALRLAAVALAGRARPGDVAVLPSYTFAATAEVLVQLGFRLRFCDVDPDTWTLDPERLVHALAPGDVRLVVCVDALGAPADYPRLRAVTRAADVPLLADSAPSLGARTGGVPVGSQADAHVFSMSFAKVVSAGGAGGALVLPARHLPALRRPVDWTRSATMAEPAAVVALDLLERLPELHARRAAAARVYDEMLGGLPGVVPQRTRPGDRHALVHWAARFPARDQLAAALDVLGVGTRAYYDPALHLLDWAGDAEPAPLLPVTDLVVGEALALPMSSELAVEQAEQVAVAVRGLVLAAAGQVLRPPGDHEQLLAEVDQLGT